MTLEDVARIVALVAGAGLVAAVAAAHLRGARQGVAGIALAVLGVLLIGFPLLERFELDLGPEGGTLSGELKTDIAATEAQLVARIDALSERLDRVAGPPPVPLPPEDGGGLRPPSEPDAPVLEPGVPSPPSDGAGEGAPPRPGEGRLALVFHRDARTADAGALVDALRRLGFAASAVPTDLSEAEDAPAGAIRILWEDGRRDAAEAAAEAAAGVAGGEPRLNAEPSDLYRGDVQVQMF